MQEVAGLSGNFCRELSSQEEGEGAQSGSSRRYSNEAKMMLRGGKNGRTAKDKNQTKGI